MLHLSKTGLLASLILSTLNACSVFYPSIEQLAPIPSAPALANLSVAHRGEITNDRLPDNSIPALRVAIQAGVPLLEVDLRRSNSGELFLFHDGSLRPHNSTAPEHLHKKPIASLSANERALASLDKAQTIKIPSLNQALDLIANSPSSLQLDLKGESDQLALEALNAVSARNLLPKVLIQIRDPRRIELVLKHHPNARVLARCKDSSQLAAALAHKIEAVELERWITQEAVTSAHEKGVLVMINVASSRFDTPSARCYLRSRGVDMIMSDFAGDKHGC
ncbi:MAG: glycerophosphodiester phosphodiesterase [Pseudomonadota bacterium]|jgi:glycerophosphoryl diester phosphodiesterase